MLLPLCFEFDQRSESNITTIFQTSLKILNPSPECIDPYQGSIQTESCGIVFGCWLLQDCFIINYLPLICFIFCKLVLTHFNQIQRYIREQLEIPFYSEYNSFKLKCTNLPFFNRKYSDLLSRLQSNLDNQLKPRNSLLKTCLNNKNTVAYHRNKSCDLILPLPIKVQNIFPL